MLRNHPTYYESQVQLGLTFYSIGRIEDAAAEWEGVVAEQPDHIDARMYLRMIGRF